MYEEDHLKIPQFLPNTTNLTNLRNLKATGGAGGGSTADGSDNLTDAEKKEIAERQKQ